MDVDLDAARPNDLVNRRSMNRVELRHWPYHHYTVRRFLDGPKGILPTFSSAFQGALLSLLHLTNVVLVILYPISTTLHILVTDKINLHLHFSPPDNPD